MSSVFYASLSALLICWLSLNVIKQRRKHRVSVGDGGNTELQTAMAAQSNAIEYLPIALLLLFALEYNEGSLLIVHAAGVALMAGRIVHARGILSDTLKIRVWRMQITLYTIISLAALNLVYLPYGKLFGS